MSNKKIRLTNIEDVRKFVRAAEKCAYDVDISYNRMIIDAKSLLGVMSMDLRHTLNVRFDEERDHAFGEYLEEFAV